MSTLIYVETTVPDKNLIKTYKYKAYLSPDQKSEIMGQLRVEIPNIDNYDVHMHVDIELKLYEDKLKKINY